MENAANDWLTRLSSDEWLQAAARELQLTSAAFDTRQIRTAVTHARRAAGMAVNAVLRNRPEGERPIAWGRSYMEHLAALQDDLTVPESVRHAARTLVTTKAAAPTLVKIGAPARGAQTAAQTILDWAVSQNTTPAA